VRATGYRIFWDAFRRRKVPARKVVRVTFAYVNSLMPDKGGSDSTICADAGDGTVGGDGIC